MNFEISNKKKIILLLVAIIVLDFIVALGVTKILTHKQEEKASVPDPSETVDVSTINTTSELNDIYSLLLVGHFKLNKDIVFNFEQDGSYSGFFDNKNREVEGYSYTLTEEEGQSIVNIFNEDKSRKVSYIMTLSEDGNIVLNLPGTDDKLELKY